LNVQNKKTETKPEKLKHTKKNYLQTFRGNVEKEMKNIYFRLYDVSTKKKKKVMAANLMLTNLLLHLGQIDYQTVYRILSIENNLLLKFTLNIFY